MATPLLDPDAPEFTHRHVNLADARLGATALATCDEFFVAKDRRFGLAANLLLPAQKLGANVQHYFHADTALRLSRYFDTTPQFWLNLQAA